MLSKRIAFIWTRIPPYAVACLSGLKKEIGENLFIGSFGEPPIHVTNEMLSNLGDVKSYKYHNNNKSDYNKIICDLELFNPDVLIVTGWSFKTLRKVSQYFCCTVTQENS